LNFNFLFNFAEHILKNFNIKEMKKKKFVVKELTKKDMAKIQGGNSMQQTTQQNVEKTQL